MTRRLTPGRLYAGLAVVEALTWAALLAGMFLKYVTSTTELGVQVAGPLHGFAFLAFCLATVVVAVDARWSAGRTLVGLVSAVVPFATLPFERATQRAGLLPGSWRLADERGSGAPERTLALALAFPVRAAGLALLLLAAVFGALLVAGPPTA